MKFTHLAFVFVMFMCLSLFIASRWKISATSAQDAPADVVAAAGAADASLTHTIANADGSNAATLPVTGPSPCPMSEQAKNIANDGATSDQFGYSVAISGDTAIVGVLGDDTQGGTDAGSAYAFTRSGAVWTQQQKLTASDGSAGDQFGISVAISGDTAIVGAYTDDTPAGTNAGSAYVFTRSGTVWTQQQKLTASDGAEFDTFGYSVAISGDTAIVGGGLDDTPAGTNAGSAYVFTRSGTVWTQAQKLTASDAAANGLFGSSIAIGGDTAIIGSNGTGTFTGSAYVFTRSGTVWTQQQKLTASDGEAGDYFGLLVAISGDTAIVGAFLDDTPAGTQAGSAYAFTRTGTVWTEQQKLTASDGATDDLFGLSVAINGDTAIVGAYLNDTPAGTNAGSAYVFTRSGTVWTQQQKLTASDGAANDQFGYSVAISGETAIVGALLDDTAGGSNAGSAYIFKKNCSTPTPTPTPTNTPTPTPIGFEGDVAPRTNGDGVVLSTDVTQLRRFAAGLDAPNTSPNEFQRADGAPRTSFGDGAINSGDVVQARRYGAGLDPLTGAGGPIGPSAIPEAVLEFFYDVYAYFFGREITIGRSESKDGSSVRVPIEMALDGDEAAVSFTLEYDAPRLANPRIELGDAVGEDAVLTVNSNEEGRIGFLVDSGTAWAASKDAKSIVVVTFDIVGDGDATVSLGDSVAKPSVSDVFGNSLAVRRFGR